MRSETELVSDSSDFHPVWESSGRCGPSNGGDGELLGIQRVLSTTDPRFSRALESQRKRAVRSYVTYAYDSNVLDGGHTADLALKTRQLGVRESGFGCKGILLPLTGLLIPSGSCTHRLALIISQPKLIQPIASTTEPRKSVFLD